MKRTLRTVVFAGIAITMTVVTSLKAQSVLVPIAPCRVLDTATKTPRTADDESSRKVDVRSTRCSRVVPPYASAYSVRITTTGRGGPDGLPASAPVMEASRRVPVPASGGPLTFPIPGNAHVAVDIDGYYVSPGVPVTPSTAGARHGITGTTSRRSYCAFAVRPSGR